MQNKGISNSGLLYFEKSILGLVFPLIIFFIVAGQLYFFQAWLFFIIWFGHVIIGSLLLSKFNPELINTKEAKKKDTKSFDKILLPLYYLIGVYGSLIIAGLDLGRFNWSNLNFNYIIIGCVLIIVSYIIANWAMIKNPFFETTVRVQKDRDQKVVISGPYRIVRHPGYLADLLWYLSLPLIFRSLYAFIPAIIAVVLLIIRTYLEDKTLQNELIGYKDYSKKVKKRLLPGIW